MKKLIFYIALFVFSTSCERLLEPEPVALLVNDLALNEPADVPSVQIGLYSSFRGTGAIKVIAGDFTADLLEHNGTFSQYSELGNKLITPANASVAGFWGSLYGSIYVANFILERLPALSGVDPALRQQILAEAHFIRAFNYFNAVSTFGDVPLVTNTNLEANRTIPRSSSSTVLNLILDDLEFALNNLNSSSVNAGFINRDAARAFAARLYLYYEEWEEAEQFATEVIISDNYALEEDFSSVILTDFSSEAILELGYTTADDPGTSTTGLNNLFLNRREIIPSNEALVKLSSNASGDRFSGVLFNIDFLSGSDNGWSVARYGTADEANNNIILLRLAELYLIRAEARTNLGELELAAEDINVLRTRANAPQVVAQSVNQMKNIIEEERVYELAYEGHRWYDLKRTGRLNAVMNAFSPNWEDHYNFWPIPEREIQYNTALIGNQNPGY